MTADAGNPNDGWRGPILRHFTPEIASVARLTIVADPDELLTEQGVLEAIRDRGFDLIPFEDHVAFRFAYESRYRQRWDRGEETNLVVVLRAQQSDVNSLPYDLLKKARRDERLISFSIGQLFSNLSPNVVSSLDRSDFDQLYAAELNNQPGQIGENATKDFILRHVFEVVPEIIKTDADLLRHLLARHYRGRVVPEMLDSRLVEQLRRMGSFEEWPLDEIVSNRTSFFEFIEERWPIFVAKHVSKIDGVAAEQAEEYGLRYGGPSLFPFDEPNIRAYMDTLFVEGFLAPTAVVSKSEVKEPWIRFGIVGDAETDALERFHKLTEIVRELIPEEDADYRTWLDFAARWAEWNALCRSIPEPQLPSGDEALVELRDKVASGFTSWMLKHFGALHSQSYYPRPAMVHHIAPYMAHGWGSNAHGEGGEKRALVVVDGLAMSQWILLRKSLESNENELSIEEGAAFAWVPTLTSVSRQSIFAAEPPQYFGKSIATTQKEPNHWRRFWEANGISTAGGAQYVCQKKQETEAELLSRIADAADHPKCRVLGVVVGTIDQMMHGNPTGSSGLHAQVENWAGQGYFSALVNSLLERGFAVFVTSDHGNIEAVGFGKPNVGATAEERGERAHVFSEEVLRSTAAENFQDAIPWPAVGLPLDYLALIAPGHFAFIPEGRRTIGHGGISLEEVVVPFVEIRAT